MPFIGIDAVVQKRAFGVLLITALWDSKSQTVLTLPPLQAATSALPNGPPGKFWCALLSSSISTTETKPFEEATYGACLLALTWLTLAKLVLEYNGYVEKRSTVVVRRACPFHLHLPLSS